MDGTFDFDRTSSSRMSTAWKVGLGAASLLMILGLVAAVHGSGQATGFSLDATSASSESVDYNDPAVEAYLRYVESYVPATMVEAHRAGWVAAGQQTCAWWDEGYTPNQILMAGKDYFPGLFSEHPLSYGITSGRDVSAAVRGALSHFCRP